jgi:hypothetical protein
MNAPQVFLLLVAALPLGGAKERTSVVRLSPNTPHGITIPLLLDNESWSYHYTPDVRYGKEDLYQAFQLHMHHLHRYEIRVR